MKARLKQGAVSVAIANWNGASYVSRCLDSVLTQTTPPEEIVVVDNGSTDGSPDTIRSRYPMVRLLTRPINEGFCRGYNTAIRATRSPYVLILNNDVFLERDFIERALDALLSEPHIGWVAGRLNRADGDGVDYVGRFLRRRLALVNADPPVPGQRVFAGSGAAIFCRRAMLDDVAEEGAYYDERFFAYLEDLDLAWRANLRGWRCVYAPDVIARHVGSASMSGRVRVLDKTMDFQRHILKNRYLTVVKNASPGVLLRLLPYLLIAEAGLWMQFLLSRSSRIRVLPQAIVQAARLLGGMCSSRRFVQSRKVAADHEIVGLMRGF